VKSSTSELDLRYQAPFMARHMTLPIKFILQDYDIVSYILSNSGNYNFASNI
jgi:hypothetical protein